MPIVTRVHMWLRALGWRTTEDRDLQREIAAHLAMEREQLERDGVPPDEARRLAAVHFGGAERHIEAVRDERGTRSLQDFGTDLRVAWRGLRRRPLFSLGTLLTLGIGIGSLTAVFAWADWLLWRPVPGVAAPARLAPFVFAKSSDAGYEPFGISYPTFLRARAAAPVLHQSAAVTHNQLQIGRANAPARTIDAEIVGGDYFGVLGVRPALGRFFSPAELDPAADARVVVISDALWRSHFGGTRDIIGRRMQINALPFTIIGVTPPAFRGEDRVNPREAWLPGSAYGTIEHRTGPVSTDRTLRFLDQMIVRLPRGTTVAAAQFALQRSLMAAAAGTEDSTAYIDYPATVDGTFGTPLRGYAERQHLAHMLLGIVTIVLLIACANTANLLLLRGVRRRGEFAIRRALGASALRVLRQHAAEGLLIAAMGALAGVGLALLLARVFGHISASGLPSFDDIPIDARVIGVACVAALTTGLAFSLAPGITALQADTGRHLRDGGRGDARRSGMVRGALTVVQISAAMTLVVGALLMVRTAEDFSRVALGLDPNHVTTYTVYADPQGYSKQRLHALRTELIDWMQHQPGVTAAASGASMQFAGSTFSERLRPIGTTGKHWPVLAVSYGVSPRYFAAMGIPLVAGRTFSDAEFDDSTSSAVLLSRTAAAQLFGAINPVGRQFEVRGFSGITRLTVIGLVGDARIYSLRDPFRPTIYRPSSGPFDFGAIFVIRSSASPLQVEREMQAGLTQFDPSLPLEKAQTLNAMVANTFASERLFERLLTVLAIIAAILSGVGLYSVIAYTVSERTREIGIRVALGALTSRVVGLVLRQGLVLAAIGVIAGTIGAYALSRTLAHWLFGVAPTSPGVYITAVAAALSIALLACLVPARAATRVNPVDALRSE